MSEFSDWVQNHWYELGSLTVQLAFLTAIVFSARALLKTLRASQEQVGALLKLSVSDSLPVRSATSLVPQPSIKPEAPPFSLLEHADIGSDRTAGILHGISVWLQTPMSTGITPWRRLIRWLQAPAGS